MIRLPGCAAVLRVALLTLPPVLSAACTADSAIPADAAEAPGTIELNPRPNDTLLGGSGTGTLYFQGQLYHFAIGGLGVDGSAIAVLQTSGRVYRLQSIPRFVGTYRKVTDAAVPAGLALRNEYGTIIALQPPPQGRIPDIGTDAVRVVMD